MKSASNKSQHRKIARVIGKAVRQHRLAKGISLKEFEAMDNSMSRQALSSIERGEKVPNIMTLHKISVILKVKIGDLVGDL